MTILRIRILNIALVLLSCMLLFQLPGTSSFSIHDSRRNETLLSTRRSNVAFLCKSVSCLLLLGRELPVKAATEDSSCQTECMYKCQHQELRNRGRAKIDTKVRSLRDCTEQCQDRRKDCRQPEPEQKREPSLLQAADIKGLYPRWQDSF
eukprot:scaffold8569_cov139-Cylindrotheca_fusiformis.AAC.9